MSPDFEPRDNNYSLERDRGGHSDDNDSHLTPTERERSNIHNQRSTPNDNARRYNEWRTSHPQRQRKPR
jgi:hypothetical protein